jgi:hypothetical protein
MANGLFTLRNQSLGLANNAWKTQTPTLILPFTTYAASFNASNQYLSTNSLTLSGDFTIECWLYYNVYGSGVNVAFFGLGNYYGTGMELWCNNQYINIDGYSGQSGYILENHGGCGMAPYTWFHFALVRSGSTITSYHNGVAHSTVTNSYSFSGTCYIGAAYNGNTPAVANFFNGSISNLRVTTNAVYTSNFDVPTSPLTNISGTQLLTLQGATIVDNSSNGYTITNSGSVATTAITMSPPYAVQQRNNPPPSVECLIVGGGGSGGGDRGAGGGGGGVVQTFSNITAGSSFTVTVGGGGAYAGGYVQGTNGSDSVFNNIVAYGGGGGGSGYGGASNGTNGSAGGSGGGATGSSSYPSRLGGVGVAGQGNRGGNMYSTSISGAGGGGAGQPGVDNYAQNLGTNGGAGVKSYLVLQPTSIGLPTDYTYGGGGGGGATSSATSGFGGQGGGGNGGNPAAAGAGLTGGGGGGSNNSGGTLNGGNGGSGIVAISYPDIYSRPVSVGTSYAPLISTSGTGSLYFNGSNYITFAANTPLDFGTGDFTIESWVLPATNSALYPTFIGSVTGWSAGASGHRFSHTGYANKFTLHLNGAGDPFLSSSNTFSGNNWHHYALTRSGNTWNMYVDGNLESTGTYSGSYNTALGGLRLGYSTWDGSNGWFKGLLSNVRFVKGVVVYTGAFTPSKKPLTATQLPSTNISAITGTQTSLLLNTVSGASLADSSANAYTISEVPTDTAIPRWDQASPIPTGFGYKNRVYLFYGSGTITF